MHNPKDFVRNSSANLELQQLLKKPSSELLGVSEKAATGLANVGIKTIFDLGTSNLFASATAALSLAASGTASARFGLVSGDLLSETANFSSHEEIPGLTIDKLRLLSPAQATELSSVLDVKTIRDLALWPPSIAARRLVGETFGATLDQEELQTEELRPRMGQYPTERVYYSTLTMLQMLGNFGVQEELEGPVSLNTALEPGGLNRPAIGALLTFSQSWFSQGVTLGHMLHSLALAPGEATRVAVIDWSRRTSSLASESIDEKERLANSTNHARSLSEVQSAVAGDLQAGGSRSSSSSDSSSGAVAGAVGTGLVTSLFASGDVSAGGQTASTAAEADSSGWSIGTRSVFAEMAQNVNDRTEQHSSSVRNRRATAIREVSQSEHQQVSTRIVANYNHMHALTVQYYEVVQVYRTEVKLERADRCLFVPMELIDFNPENPTAIQLVERFRPSLFAAALNTRIRFLLSDDSWNGTRTVGVTPDAKSWLSARRGEAAIAAAIATFLGTVSQAGNAGGFSPNGPAIFQAVAQAALATIAARAKDMTISESATMAEAKSVIPGMITALQAGPIPGIQFQSGAAIAQMSAAVDAAGPAVFRVIRNSRSWDDEAIAALTRVLGRSPLRADSDSLFIPESVQILSISFTNPGLNKGRLDLTSGPIPFTVVDGRVDLAALSPVKIVPTLEDITAIFLDIADSPSTPGSMLLNCAYLGRQFSLPPIPLDSKSGLQRVLRIDIQETEQDKEILSHLNSHRSYYSRAVFRMLDSATLTQILSHYKWNNKPLIEIVEPGPVRVIGNYMILRAPVDGAEDSGLVDEKNQPLKWQAYLQKRGLDFSQPANQRLIPIPTDGVFAEAVLGRANSAEKLDITRFWNWQDSPIPLTPAEISPVSTASRAMAEDLKPGQLSQPVLNIVNPTSLPAPDSVSTVLNAMSNLNFRDMSGLSGTQGLVKAGMDGTLQAATNAGQLVSENMRTEAQKSVAMGQIAADLVKSLVGGGGGSSSTQGISAAGAKINHGRSMDERGAATSSGASNASGVTGSSAGGTGSSGGDALPGRGGVSGTGAFPSSALSREAAYSDQAVHGYSPDVVRSTLAAAEESTASLQNVDDRYVRPAYSTNELVGLVGENIAENEFRRQGFTVFSDWRKHVSETGFDMAVYVPHLDGQGSPIPNEGTIWIVDNKAQFRGIGNANALTGDSFNAYKARLRQFIGRWPNINEAQLAINALDRGTAKLVVSNGFAGESTRFTKGLFDRGLHAFDVRLGRLFGPTEHEAWSLAYKAMQLQKSLRRIPGLRGVAMLEGTLLTLAVSGGVAYLFSDKSQIKTAFAEAAATLAFDTVLSRLPGGIIAGFVLGLQSDETSEAREARIMNERIDYMMGAMPALFKLSGPDQQAARDTIKELLQNPIRLPDPPEPPKAPFRLPFMPSPIEA